MNGPASTPDLMAIAKGIGGGFPMGACLATDEAAVGMTAGVHGTTFGGNPLAMAVGNAVLDVVLDDGFLDDVARKALLLKQGLAAIADEFPDVDRGHPRRRPDARPEMRRAERQGQRGAARPEGACGSGRRQCRAAAAAAGHFRRGDPRSASTASASGVKSLAPATAAAAE